MSFGIFFQNPSVKNGKYWKTYLYDHKVQKFDKVINEKKVKIKMWFKGKIKNINLKT